MVQRFLLILLATVFLRGTLDAQTGIIPTGVVAKAGNEYITEREFIERFELSPTLQRGRGSRVEDAKLDLVYSMIAERLLAQEARERGLDRDSAFQSAFESVRKVLARDELYKQEVSGKVGVSESEILRGVAEAQEERLIAFIYCDHEADARFLRKQIRSFGDFGILQIDTSFGATRDTATVIWGDADPAIERAAYRLAKQEISPVIEAGTGFYILKIEGTRRSDFYTSLAPSVLRERVGAIVRERKEEARLNEFVTLVLEDKIGYSRAHVLRSLATALGQVFREKEVLRQTALDPELAGLVREKCRDILSDTLAVAGRVVWSTSDIIDRLLAKGFAVDSAGLRTIAKQLNAQVMVWVHQELLEQEAIARRLDQYPAVQRQLEMWQQSMLAQQMKMYLKRRVEVTDAELWSGLRSSDSSVVIPRVTIREVRTKSLDEMETIVREFEQGVSFDDVVRKRWVGPGAGSKSGVYGPFPVSERFPVGEIAWQMEVGQRFGPVQEGDGYTMFELLSKESVTPGRDTVLTAVKSSVQKELRRQKEKRLTDLFLAQSGSSKGFMIYQDRLSRIQVSPVPMMTFRILGFGGRMFAVPFVDRQIDWLNIEPPASRIVF